MTTYIGLLKPGEADGYQVLFPDFPGLLIADIELHQIEDAATTALARHIQRMRTRGEPVPRASHRDEIESANKGTGILVCLEIKLAAGTPNAREASLVDVIDKGEMLILDDGSKWHVEPACLPRSQGWSPADRIRVFERELWNLPRREGVQAVRLK